MRSLLEDWREAVFDRDHRRSSLDSTAILSDEEVAHLSSVGELTLEILEGILKPSWLWWGRYGQELVEHTKGIEVTYVPLPKAPRKTKRAPAEDTDKTEQSAKKPRTAAESTRPHAPLPLISGPPHAAPPQANTAGPSNPSYAALALFPSAAHPIGGNHLSPQPIHQQSLQGQYEPLSRGHFQPAPMLPPPVISNTDVYSTWYGQPFAHPSPPPPVDEHGRGPPHWQDSRGPMYAYPSYTHPGWITAQSIGVYAPPQHFPYTSQPTPPIYTHPEAQQGPRHPPPGPRDTR